MGGFCDAFERSTRGGEHLVPAAGLVPQQDLHHGRRQLQQVVQGPDTLLPGGVPARAVGGFAQEAVEGLEPDRYVTEDVAGPLHHLADGVGLEGVGAQHLLLAEVVDERAVRADGGAAVAGRVGDLSHPARRSAGDEDDVDASPLAGVERGDRAGADGAVGADDGPVEVSGHHAHGAQSRPCGPPALQCSPAIAASGPGLPAISPT